MAVQQITEAVVRDSVGGAPAAMARDPGSALTTAQPRDVTYRS